MQDIRVFCKGKINLSLNITGIDETSKLHNIDSVMQSINFGDYITVLPTLKNKVNIYFVGEGADKINPDNNTVLKTVEIIKKQFGDFGADIVVEKHLPLMAGLGGSSVDSAGLINALDKLFDFSLRGLDINKTALSIGSDVPFMIGGGCALVKGIGQNITQIKNNLPLNILLVREDNSFCLTKDVYSQFDKLNKSKKLILTDNNRLINLLNNGESDAIKLFSNALTESAKIICPSINSLFDLLFSLDSINVILCGSGSMLAAFFETKQKAIDAEEKLKQKGYYTKICTN